jgi:GT2 family glycosyltransferase
MVGGERGTGVEDGGSMTVVLARPARTVSVIICAYTEDRWDDMNAAIESAKRQSVAPHEVILVIDHSDALAKRARKRIGGVQVVESVGPRGLSGARNTGVDVATGDVVAFLDDDATADDDWLEQLLSAYRDPDVGGAGGSVEPSWVDARPGWFPREFDWVIGCSHSGMPAATAGVRNFVGANMSFRRDLLRSLGGFSSELGRTGANAAGCEETELCIRAASSPDSKLVYEPAARVLHRVPPSRGTWKYFLKRCYAEGTSKARVSELTGADSALSAERSYLGSTIPKGIVRSLAAVGAGDFFGPLRALAIVLGTLTTFAGYARARVTRAEVVGTTTLIAIVGLWAVVMHRGVPLSRMSDLGLVSVLPATYWACVVAVTVSFGIWIRRATARPMFLAAHFIVLLAVLHATPTLLYGSLRYSWAWKHVAIVDYVIAHHGVNIHQAIPSLVAYQDWPGFFTLGALFTGGSGLSTALGIATWGPFVNELLYAGPLLIIFKTFTSDRRIYLTALWIFYLGNWIGQDYFSPQGYAYFLYLVVIAICLKHFRSDRLRSAPAESLLDEHGVVFDDSHRPAYYAVAVALIVAIASSHQLTPFMLVSALILLAITRRLHYRSLPVVAAIATVGWMALFARTFVQDNVHTLISGLGAFFSNASVHQVNGSFASPDELLVSKADRLLTVAIIVLAIVGYLRNRIGGQRRGWLKAVLLLISPLVALAANSYGGEIVFRVLLFSLPFLALFGASALQPAGRAAGSHLADMSRIVLLVAMAIGFVVSNYGNDRANYFPPQEISSLNTFYNSVPAGSYVTGFVGNDPWALENYDKFTYYWYTQVSPQALNSLVTTPIKTLIHDMSPYPNAYVVLTSSDLAEIEMTGLMPQGAPQRIANDLLESKRFQVIESNSSTLIFKLRSTQQSSPSTYVAPGAIQSFTAGSNQDHTPSGTGG